MFKMTPKKFSLVLTPVLAMSLLVGCSQSEVKPSYSQEFKEQFLYMANTYNEREDFTEQYQAIQWDDTKNAPHLSENMTITSYSEKEIEIELFSKLSDIEFEMTLLMEKLSNPISLTEEEYEQLSNQHEELAEKYYEELEMKEETILKTDNTTLITQCLVYAMMGEENNEDAIEVVKETFYGLGLMQSLMGMAENDYYNFLLNNLYLVDDETIYGKLAYNKELNHDEKALVSTFKFTNYHEGMDQEMKEVEEKLKEFEEEIK